MRAALSFELSQRRIDIWTLPTKAPPRVVTIFERVLVAEEMDRASRFRFNHLSASFIIARGALRYLLGHCLDCDPAEVAFVYGIRGKPALAVASGIHFNVTHAGTLAVIALTLGREIGVDVELIRPVSEMHQIAGRFFCPEEASEIKSLPQTEQERAFFSCWTRKEAYIKATGYGLSVPLAGFRVTVGPDVPPRLIHIEHNTSEAQEWTLHDLHVAAGYAAALAYRDRRRSLSFCPVVDPAELLALM